MRASGNVANINNPRDYRGSLHSTQLKHTVRPSAEVEATQLMQDIRRNPSVQFHRAGVYEEEEEGPEYEDVLDYVLEERERSGADVPPPRIIRRRDGGGEVVRRTIIVTSPTQTKTETTVPGILGEEPALPKPSPGSGKKITIKMKQSKR